MPRRGRGRGDGPGPGDVRHHPAEHGPGRGAGPRHPGCRGRGRPGRVAVEALGEARYWGLLRVADAMLGNSSSALVEAPALGLPAVNVGDRQAGRHREANVLDAPAEAAAVADALRQALTPAFREAARAASPRARRRSGRGAHRGYHRRMASIEPAAQAADPAGAVTPRTRSLLLIGGGEHAGVVLEAARVDAGRVARRGLHGPGGRLPGVLALDGDDPPR